MTALVRSVTTPVLGVELTPAWFRAVQRWSHWCETWPLQANPQERCPFPLSDQSLAASTARSTLPRESGQNLGLRWILISLVPEVTCLVGFSSWLQSVVCQVHTVVIVCLSIYPSHFLGSLNLQVESSNIKSTFCFWVEVRSRHTAHYIIRCRSHCLMQLTYVFGYDSYFCSLTFNKRCTYISSQDLKLLSILTSWWKLL